VGPVARVAATARSSLVGPELEAARDRSKRTLVAGVALGSIGHIAAVSVAAIAAEDLLGEATWAGLPGAMVVLGAASGTVALSAIMVRRGRRDGLTAGYVLGVLGGLLAALAVIGRDLPMLLLGALLIGFGNSSNQLSRYAAGDLVPVERRAWAIGIVVWAATVGAIVGPALVPVAEGLARWWGIPGLAGPFFVPVVFVGAAALLSFARLRPDPYALADRTAADDDAGGATVSLGIVLRRPTVAAAIVALLVGQFVMTFLMTMTPLHMTGHGHDLGAVGIVLAGHTTGMFALSPVSGRLAQRLGLVPTIFLGGGLLAVAALMSIVAPPDGGAMLFVALFLLGFGWNLGFVAGSALLSTGMDLAERTRVQGLADALIWSSAAVASLGSGVVLAVAGFTALGVLCLGLIGLAVLAIASRRAAIRVALAGH
jgi:MFS family permease